MSDQRTASRARRADLTARGYCLNGEKHGPATHGRCCAWCRSVHNIGLAKTAENAAAGTGPSRPVPSIALDDASIDASSARLASPPSPNAALRDLMAPGRQISIWDSLPTGSQHGIR